MEIYIVGGYCRDTVMGKIPHDRDFVVVGGMIKLLICGSYMLNFILISETF